MIPSFLVYVRVEVISSGSKYYGLYNYGRKERVPTWCGWEQKIENHYAVVHLEKVVSNV